MQGLKCKIIRCTAVFISMELLALVPEDLWHPLSLHEETQPQTSNPKRLNKLTSKQVDE